MIAKIRALVEKYWDILSYLFFGGLTTVVNYIVYLPCYNWLGISATVSNVIAWIVAGLPFDITHGISNFLCGILIVPLIHAIRLADKTSKS